ncbi:MAG: DNA-3-methyladenine glycosylase I [Rhodoferax sp.]|nr:DNA-3-methyladenine glycosylase I [Actinomycetota bacterium]
MSEGLVLGADGLRRCAWAGQAPDYTAYHDGEWGRVVHGERALFERLTLEAFQSGLSWITILRKREGFRRAFAEFDVDAIAAFGPGDGARLMADVAIVRNGAKIRAAVANARAVVDLRVDGGLDAFVWSFAPDPAPPRPTSPAEIRATSPESVALAKALKARGFSFVGPTTSYAGMQACGLVDDHLRGCHVAAA